jgi:hypothetical protein
LIGIQKEYEVVDLPRRVIVLEEEFESIDCSQSSFTDSLELVDDEFEMVGFDDELDSSDEGVKSDPPQKSFASVVKKP